MTNRPLYTFRGPKFSAKERQVLDAIGKALKKRAIDFKTAAELGELVKAGKVDEVAKRLEDQNDEQ